MSNKMLRIFKLGKNETIDFAVKELKDYIKKMSEGKQQVDAEERAVYIPEEKGIWVGLKDNFENLDIKKAENPELDDAIFIKVENGNGIISGVNPRSILLSVYRYLWEAGCRWVRPGIDGEFIPHKDMMDISVEVNELPSYRHRGICIEGAVSLENVLDIVDWAPKLGFNAYFTQFREAYTFFERWYTHRGNPIKAGETFSIEKAREYIKVIECEINKRSIIYHAVGHGWTCEPVGLPGLDWDTMVYDVAPEFVPYLAEVNGKREVWMGLPLNTNLCYSKKEVKDLITNSIVEYLEIHKNIDLLHFWLADGFNNQCECEGCKNTRPSDLYVQMLNQLDEKLSEKQIDTRVVFLIYVDLLWAPEVERIKNQDRFIMMFAPITRTYSHSFKPEGKEVAISPYDRNKLKFPSSVDENVAFLKSWQDIFKGDSFDFDYHMMWDHYSDPGYYQIAQILCDDIKNLKGIGLDGYISCQTQRALFPTGLPMNIMGRTLWNDKLDFEKEAQDYFNSAFGEDGLKCKHYLSKISELFDPPYLRGEKEKVDPQAEIRFKSIPGFIGEFRPMIEQNLNNGNPCHRKSWEYLKIHAEICDIFANILVMKARGEEEEALLLWEKLSRFIWEKEDRIQPVFDGVTFSFVVERFVKSTPSFFET